MATFMITAKGENLLFHIKDKHEILMSNELVKLKRHYRLFL